MTLLAYLGVTGIAVFTVDIFLRNIPLAGGTEPGEHEYDNKNKRDFLYDKIPKQYF